jgi:hypothetical protein
MGGGRPYKHYREENYEHVPGEYRVIEKHLDDEQPKDESPEEDFLLSDMNNNKEASASPVKEHKKETHSPVKEHKKEIHSPVKEHKKETHSPVKEHKKEKHSPVKEHHISYKLTEDQIQQSHFGGKGDKVEKHLKDLIEDRESNSGNNRREKFDDVHHVQNTSFHIPTKQAEKKEHITSNTGFTISTNPSIGVGSKYSQQQSTQTKHTPTVIPTSTGGKKKEEPQQPQAFPQMPYMPYPYPMFFYPPGYDPNMHGSSTPNSMPTMPTMPTMPSMPNMSNMPNMPMTPYPMYYMPPQYMQQPEKVETDTRKSNYSSFGAPQVNLF